MLGSSICYRFQSCSDSQDAQDDTSGDDVN